MLELSRTFPIPCPRQRLHPESWYRDLVQLLCLFKSQITIPFNALFSITFHVIITSDSFCLRFLSTRYLFSCSGKDSRFEHFSVFINNVPFDLHSRWVHPKYMWSRNDFGCPRSTKCINFFQIGLRFCFFPAFFFKSCTYKDRNTPGFRCTNMQAQFGTFSVPGPNRINFFKLSFRHWSRKWLTKQIPSTRNNWVFELDHDLGQLCRGTCFHVSGHSDLGTCGYCISCLSCASWSPCNNIHNFCGRHLWWRTLLCEYCIRARIVFHNVASEYNSTFVFLVLCLQFGILQMTDVYQWGKMNCPPFFLCLFDDLLFALCFGHWPCWQFVALPPLFVHCNTRIPFFFSLLDAWALTCAQDCDDPINWITLSCNAIFMIVRQRSLQTISRRFVSFYDACMLWFASVRFVFAMGFSVPKFSNLARRGCFHGQFQRCPRVFSWFPWTPRLFVELLSPFLTKSLAINNRVLMLLEFLSAAPWTTGLRLKVFHSLSCTARNWSMLPMDPGHHQRSDNHQHGFPATHPVSYSSAWQRQKIAVVLGILLSAHGAQLLVQRDDDECDSLRSSKHRCGLDCHPLACLTVETRPTLRKERRCALRLVQGNPGLRWIFGTPALCQTTWLVHLRSGMWNGHHFSAWEPPSQWGSEHEFLTRPNFPAPQCLRPKYLLSKFSPHAMQIQRIFQVKLSYPWLVSAEIEWCSTIAAEGIMGSLIDSPQRLSNGVFPSPKKSCTFREVVHVHQWRTLMLSLCASRMTSFLLLTFLKSHAGIVSSFFSIPCPLQLLHTESSWPVASGN